MLTALDQQSPTTDQADDTGEQVQQAKGRPVVSFETISAMLPIVDLAIIISATVAATMVTVMLFPVYATAEMSALHGLGLVASGLYVMRLRGSDFYDSHVLRRGGADLRTIVETWAMSVLVLICLIYLFKIQHADTRRAFIIYVALTPVLLAMWRLWIKSLVRRALARQAIGRRDIIVIGEADEFAAPDFADLAEGLGIAASVRFGLTGDRKGFLTEADQNVVLAAVAYAQQNDVSEALLLADWSDPPRVAQLRAALRSLPVPARLLPDHRIRSVTSFSPESPPYLIQVELQRAPLSGVELLTKRTIDIVLSAVGLVILAVPMLIVAALIRLESRGPAIFKQRRIGFNRREFTIYKFRTMRVQEEGAEVRQARVGDERVTRLGRILRATSFDEFPQLFNVLLGEMSLVGPRPHAIVHDHEFEKELAEYAFRRHVKPGITGWAQCQGRRGPTPTIDDVRERVELDLWYIANWRLTLDIYILFRTMFIFLGQRNAL